MPTLDVDATNDWVDIKTGLSLTEGEIYVVDCVTGDTAYIREDATEPTGTIGHPIKRGESRVVTIASEKLWVRSAAPAKLVLTLEV